MLTKCCKALFNSLNSNESCYSATTSCHDVGTGKRFTLNSSSRKNICTIKIDGCIIKSHASKKCDFLIVECSTKTYHFIELKGKDFAQAFEQLDNAIYYVKEKIGHENSSINLKGYILLNRTPSKSNQEVRSLQASFLKKHKIIPLMKTGTFWNLNV